MDSYYDLINSLDPSYNGAFLYDKIKVPLSTVWTSGANDNTHIQLLVQSQKGVLLTLYLIIALHLSHY